MMIWKVKLLFFFTFFGFVSVVNSQTISFKSFEQGEYGAGSTVAALFAVDDPNAKLRTDNIFKLYLSGIGGDFSQETEIGSFPGFYATYINGLIPSNTPSGSYRLRIKASGSGAVSEASETISIGAKPGVVANIDAPASQTLSSNPKIFGICKPEIASTFSFSNASSAGANVNLTIVNELTSAKEVIALNGSLNYKAALAHYTILVRSELNGVIGTKAFFLINNIIKPGFNSPANNTVCLPAELSYDIETQSVNGIQNNFPGYSYQVNWGDNTTENFTPAQIKVSGGKVKHIYTQSSCGKQIKINDVFYYNVFGIIYQVSSPYCGLVSVPVSTQAKVITQPENRFQLPEAVCINTNLSIGNSSVAGDNPSSNSPECQNNNVLYYWYVDGKAVTPQGVPITYVLNHTFTTPGNHVIRLESVSNSNCQAQPVEKNCYVQAAPKPAFTASELLACAGTTIKFTNQSNIDEDPRAQNTLSWKISGPPVSFLNGTSSTSANPEIQFLLPGVYTVTLSITSPCGVAVAEKEIVINNKPQIIANWQTVVCGKDQLFTFNGNDGNIMSTKFDGTAKDQADSYLWTITGGKFSFKNGTNEKSREPSILFEDYATYDIKISHRNNCGLEETTKSIRFNEAPTVNAGPDVTICAGAEVTLNGNVANGAGATFAWKGGLGKFSPNRNTLNAIYTPTAEEIQAGTARLSLSVTTSNPAPCNLVEDYITISINPVNKITSPATKSICTGNGINYEPSAFLSGSSFKWTASGSANVTGFSTSGTGNIIDKPVNTDLEKDAEIVYTIIPEKDGCTGEAFKLTVTVTGTPSVKATAISNIICSGKSSEIKLIPNFEGLRYTWTSTVSGKIAGNSQQSAPTSSTSIIDTLINTGVSAGSVTYTIIPENINGCIGKPVVVTVNVSSSPGIAVFSPNKTVGCSPFAVSFSNTTPGEIHKFSWDFGDGQTLITTDNKPVHHTFTTSSTKIFKVRLVTETDCGIYSKEYNIKVTPNTILPELVVAEDEYAGCAPHTVNFSNNSRGALLYKYDFGDGTIIETNQSPEVIRHTFQKEGTYIVKLTASNGCSDTTTTETIRVYPRAVTDFSADVTSGCKSLKVKFTNKSTGAKSYLWVFGDGAVSTETNPTHIFSNMKSLYDVSLISTSYFGCNDTLERKNFIEVVQPPAVDFQVVPGIVIQYPNHRFAFKNKTEGDNISFKWDFGDGATSSAKDAEHSYADTGSYTVRLVATNPTGCSDIQVKIVKITGTPGSLFLPNALMPNSVSEEVRSFKAKGSGLEKWQMRVYNKWGEVIWETDKLDEKGSPVEGWDGTIRGTAAPQGVYFWDVKAKFKNGAEWPGMIYNGSDPKKIGTINLIR